MIEETIWYVKLTTPKWEIFYDTIDLYIVFRLEGIIYVLKFTPKKNSDDIVSSSTKYNTNENILCIKIFFQKRNFKDTLSSSIII